MLKVENNIFAGALRKSMVTFLALSGGALSIPALLISLEMSNIVVIISGIVPFVLLMVGSYTYQIGYKRGARDAKDIIHKKDGWKAERDYVYRAWHTETEILADKTVFSRQRRSVICYKDVEKIYFLERLAQSHGLDTPDPTIEVDTEGFANSIACKSIGRGAIEGNIFFFPPIPAGTAFDIVISISRKNAIPLSRQECKEAEQYHLQFRGEIISFIRQTPAAILESLTNIVKFPQYYRPHRIELRALDRSSINKIESERISKALRIEQIDGKYIAKYTISDPNPSHHYYVVWSPPLVDD